MPSGVLVPGPGSLDEVGVVDLVNAQIPLPSVEAWTMTPLFLLGSFASLADPRPDEFLLQGVKAPTHDLAYLNRIHVIPRRYDVGLLASEQIIDVEVWNAFLYRAKTLTEILSEGPTGIEVIDPLGTPAHFQASESVIYQIKVLAEGNPVIDNLITWLFVGIDSDGTNIRVVGFRLIPWPFEPDFLLALVETYGYKTDVIAAAFNGNEQRVQLREKPIGSIAFTCTFLEQREAQMAMIILEGNQGRLFGVPRWQFRTPLVEDLAVDEDIVYCDTQYLPFEPDGLVCLWIDAFTWEVQTISEVYSDHLVLDSVVRHNWPKTQTFIIPMVPGRLSSDEVYTWKGLLQGQTALAFEVDSFKP